jgi:hypothetical protein
MGQVGWGSTGDSHISPNPLCWKNSRCFPNLWGIGPPQRKAGTSPIQIRA